jgi:hypothetical protein
MKQDSSGPVITVGERIGYVRVSTVAQTLDQQQQQALEKSGVTKTFSDTMSGARDDRPGLAELMAYVREGDTVVVWKLDRLGRNTLHILEPDQAQTVNPDSLSAGARLPPGARFVASAHARCTKRRLRRWPREDLNNRI